MRSSDDKKLERDGYIRHETDWEVVRGGKMLTHKIVDAVVSQDGKYVYTKLGEK